MRDNNLFTLPRWMVLAYLRAVPEEVRGYKISEDVMPHVQDMLNFEKKDAERIAAVIQHRKTASGHMLPYRFIEWAKYGSNKLF